MQGDASKPISRYTVQTPLGVIQLATDETFVSIRESRLVPPVIRIDPMDILLQMSGVSTPDQLGDQGAPLASIANPENICNDEVRRYEARFGRDALYAAEFLSSKWPQLELGVVRYLAAYQARDFDERSQAAPGKVPNHIRRPDDKLAQQLTAETGRRWPWFGGTDTTVQFLLAASRVLKANPEAGLGVPALPAGPSERRQVCSLGNLATHPERRRDRCHWMACPRTRFQARAPLAVGSDESQGLLYRLDGLA